MLRISRKIKEIHISIINTLEVLLYLRTVLWKASKSLTIILFILALSRGLTLIIELFAITILVNRLIEQDFTKIPFSQSILILAPWVVIFIGAMLVKHVILTIQPYISIQLQERASSILKNDYFKKALLLDLSSFETEEYYNNLEMVKDAISNQLTRALQSLGIVIASVAELLVIIVSASKIGVLIGPLLIIGSIPLIIFNIKTSKEYVQINYQQSPLKRQISYWRSLSTSRETAAELRLFNMGPFFLDKWQNLNAQLINELYKVRKRIAYLKVKGELILISLLSLIIIGTVIAGISGTITIGTLVAFLYMLNRFEQAISQVTGHGEMLTKFYYKFKYVPKFLKSKKEEINSELKAPEIKHGIVFENVSFTYPSSSKPALKNINLHILPGEKISLVGENGAGKSTLALLILGLYQPTEGRILVDGIDLKDISHTSWRKKTAAVFQNFVRYQLSAENNINFGDINHYSRIEIKQAALSSGIDSVISNLSKGYRTLLGKEYEDAQDLSGGEWQKVAISRSYYRQAELIVLDEPAAALDAQAEYDVYKQFSEVSEGKTTILISHRLGSARLADKIVYLQNGQLIESGTHDELLERNNKYSNMYRLQAEWYQEEKGEKDGTRVYNT